MLGREYREEYDRDYIMQLLRELAAMGAKTVVLTGVSFEPGRLGAVAYDSGSGEYFEYFGEHLPVNFHGTGDIFSSAVVGAVMNGMGVNDALKLAVDYTAECIRLTLREKNHSWYGVNFEQATPYLLSLLSRDAGL